MKTLCVFLPFFLSTMLSGAQPFIFTLQNSGLGNAGRTAPFHMDAVSEDILWASASGPWASYNAPLGHPNIITHTTDGGLTWKVDTLPVEPSEHFRIACISASGPDSAWVSALEDGPGGYFPRVLATFDGGDSWTEQDVGFINSYGAQIHFFDHTEGVLVGAGAGAYHHQIFKTYDAGNTWIKLSPENLPDMPLWEYNADDGYAAMGDTIWVGTSRGRVLRSTNRGEHWSALETPVNALIYEVSFSSPLHGIARYTSNDGQRQTKTMLITMDGGETWPPHTPGDIRDAVYGLSSLPGVPGAYLCSSYTLSLERLGLFISYDNGYTWDWVESAGQPGRIAMVDGGNGWISELNPDTEDVDVYRLEAAISPARATAPKKLEAFPNPAADHLVIRLEKGKGFGFSLEVLDIRGRRLARHQAQNDSFILPLNLYTAGLYYLRIEQNGAVYSGKFIKQ